MTQVPFTEGTTTYIMSRDKKSVKVRYLGPDGELKLTLAGKRFYSQAPQEEYLVSVPVTIRGRRKRGTLCERESYLPVDMLQVNQIMVSGGYPENEKEDMVRSLVLAQLDQSRTAQGEVVLLVVSGETHTYNSSQSWQISKLNTTHDEAGRTVAEAAMRLPTRGPRKLLAAAHLPFEAEACVEEAFEDYGDNLCVCRQIAVLTKRSLRLVCDRSDNILDDGGAWRDVGITGEPLRRYCALLGHPLFFHCLRQSYRPPRTKREDWPCVGRVLL